MQSLDSVRVALVLVLAGCVASCSSGADGDPSNAKAPTASHSGASAVWFDGSFAEAVAQAKARKEFVFVDVFTTWCGPCKMLEKQTFSDPEVKAELAKMVSISLDAESPSGAPVADQYHVSGYPTLLVLDGDGKEVGRITGFLGPEPFLAKLDEIRARAPRK
jgi:thiol:disulfide interchange protein